MSFDPDASDRMVAWRDRVLASATALALIGDESGIHYPERPALTGDAAADLPLMVLYREKFAVERSAPGENFEGSGNSMSAVLYFDPAVHSIAKVEAMTEDICAEIVESEAPDTLDVIRAECTRASEVAKSQEAAAEDGDNRKYRTIAIVAWYS